MDAHKKKNFIEAYDKYADAIYRHCFFRVFKSARAEELMQETFMKTWEYIRGGAEVENIRAFIYKVANNLIIDESRKRKEESLDFLMESGFDPSGNSNLDRPENKAAFSEVMDTIKSLPKEDGDILIMRFIDDLRPKDIADILSVSANVVSVRISRALKLAKEEFNK